MKEPSEQQRGGDHGHQRGRGSRALGTAPNHPSARIGPPGDRHGQKAAEPEGEDRYQHAAERDQPLYPPRPAFARRGGFEHRHEGVKGARRQPQRPKIGERRHRPRGEAPEILLHELAHFARRQVEPGRHRAHGVGAVVKHRGEQPAGEGEHGDGRQEQIEGHGAGGARHVIAQIAAGRAQPARQACGTLGPDRLQKQGLVHRPARASTKPCSSTEL